MIVTAQFLPVAEAAMAWEGSAASRGAEAFSTDVPGSETVQYKLSGNWTVLPSSIHDDGARTYIQWGPTQSIPAVFGVDERGEEVLVDGHMREGSFTIDRVYARLVFRVDKAKGAARRSPVRRK